jgi:hypothetical protein
MVADPGRSSGRSTDRVSLANPLVALVGAWYCESQLGRTALTCRCAPSLKWGSLRGSPLYFKGLGFIYG